MTDVRLNDAADHDRVDVLAVCRAALLPEDVRDDRGLDELLWRVTPQPIVRLVAREGAGVVGVMVAGASGDPSEVGVGYVTLIAVHPDHQRAGLGRLLVRGMEARLEAAGISEIWTGGSQPHYWWPGIDSRYTAARDLFVSQGYSDGDTAVNLKVDLSSAVVAGASVDGITTRRLTTGEFPDFQSWMRARWDGVWDREIELCLRRVPVSCFVAEQGGGYVGFAAYDTNRVGSFGPMGSIPQIRGRGVGTALLRLCLRDYLERGDRDCKISWAGPQAFYRDTVAAQPDREFTRLRKVLAP